jgi:hypothetical protein
MGLGFNLSYGTLALAVSAVCGGTIGCVAGVIFGAIAGVTDLNVAAFYGIVAGAIVCGIVLFGQMICTEITLRNRRGSFS